jgi:hypothetical protein
MEVATASPSFLASEAARLALVVVRRRQIIWGVHIHTVSARLTAACSSYTCKDGGFIKARFA